MMGVATAGGESFALADLGALRITGADAHSFLQGQLSNDLERLTRDRPLLTALNTSQGRVVAILRLVQRTDGIVAILPAALIAPVIERLRKYVLRSKVTLSDESSRLAVVGLLDVSLLTADDAPDLAQVAGGHIGIGEISVQKLPGPAVRYLLVGPASALPATVAAVATPMTTSERWRLAAIESGEPQVYPETSDLFVAQMLNLDLVDGLSFSKGCYTGQEIIARTQHRGRIKRRMLRYRISGAGAVARGEQVGLDDGRVGRVVECAARTAAESELLAVVPLEWHGRETTDAATRSLSVERLPLPYSIPDL